jgi:aspartate-semialdehyde dehydrogenase
MPDVRIGVVGATGAVGSVTLELLTERGFEEVRAFASARSAGRTVPFGGRELLVEEATAEALAAGDLDLVFFSVGTDASRELVPHAVRGGAVVIDKSDAYRLCEGIPLVVAGVNDHALDGSEIVANPNCSAMQLACVLEPLREAAGLARVRLATYQSASGAGDAGIERLRSIAPAEGDLGMDWELDGEEFSEEWKLRAETRKILALPELPLHATCVRVPVLVGHAQAVWVETESPLAPEKAREALASSEQVELADLPTPADAAGRDKVLVGRIRQDTAGEGLALWAVNDNLRKGAALNAVQIAELLLARRLLPA